MRISHWSSDVWSSDLEAHRPDVSHVLSAARAIAPVLVPGNLVILESTSPVGTTEKVAAEIAALRPAPKVPGTSTGAADLFIAHCPEWVLLGRLLVQPVDHARRIGGKYREAEGGG